MVASSQYYRWFKTRGVSAGDVLILATGSVRYLTLRLRYRGRLLGGPFSLRAGADVRIGSAGQLSVGRFVRILQNFTGRINGRLTIGDNVFFNRGCYLSAQQSVSIGNDCLFGEYVAIHDEDHVIGPDETPIGARGYVTAPIVIGNNVWVGAKATILKGVRIGDNAVIGANAVVTKDIPANSIAVGVPARVIRTINGPAQVNHTVGERWRAAD